MSTKRRPARRTPPTFTVQVADGPPLDVEAWVARYFAFAMERIAEDPSLLIPPPPPPEAA